MDEEDATDQRNEEDEDETYSHSVTLGTGDEYASPRWSKPENKIKFFQEMTGYRSSLQEMDHLPMDLYIHGLSQAKTLKKIRFLA